MLALYFCANAAEMLCQIHENLQKYCKILGSFRKCFYLCSVKGGTK